MVLQSVLKECFQLTKTLNGCVRSCIHLEQSAVLHGCTALCTLQAEYLEVAFPRRVVFYDRAAVSCWHTETQNKMTLCCFHVFIDRNRKFRQHSNPSSSFLFYFFKNMLNDQQQSTVFVKLKGHSSGGCCSGQFYLECLVLYDSCRNSAHKHTFPERSLVSSHTLSRHD